MESRQFLFKFYQIFLLLNCFRKTKPPNPHPHSRAVPKGPNMNIWIIIAYHLENNPPPPQLNHNNLLSWCVRLIDFVTLHVIPSPLVNGNVTPPLPFKRRSRGSYPWSSEDRFIRDVGIYFTGLENSVFSLVECSEKVNVTSNQTKQLINL